MAGISFLQSPHQDAQNSIRTYSPLYLCRLIVLPRVSATEKSGASVPMEIDGFSIDGLREVENRILEARQSYNPYCKLAGVLITKFSARTKMDRDGLAFLREKTKFPVFKSVIHMSVKVKESVFAHIPVVEYAKKCRSAVDYRNFIAEIVPNLGTI